MRVKRGISIFILTSMLLMVSSQIIVADVVVATSPLAYTLTRELYSYLLCISMDAKYRSEHYENISFIFTPKVDESLVKEYLGVLQGVAKDYAEAVQNKIGPGGIYSNFKDLLIEYGKDALKELFENDPNFEVVKCLANTFSSVKVFLNYLMPHDCVIIVYNAANKIQSIVIEGRDGLALSRAYQTNVQNVPQLLSDINNICKDEIKTIEDIINGKLHPIDLRSKLEDESKEIDIIAENIRKLLDVSEITTERRESFAVFLGELAEFKAYLLTILRHVMPDFDVTVNEGIMSVSENGTAFLSINVISKNGFDGDVTLSVEWVGKKPDWVAREEFNPQVVTLKPNTCASSTLSIAVSDFAEKGDYALKIIGKCSSAIRYKEVKFTVRTIGAIRAELNLSPKVIEVDQSVSIEIKAFFENGTLVPNAKIEAWVRKPDGSRSDVALNYHAGMRKYTGEYWDTSLPGTYTFYAKVGKLFYAPHLVSASFKVQKFSYNLDVYAIEDYDYELTSNLTYPYDLNEITSSKGVKYKVTVVAPFEDGFLAKIWKNNEEIFYGDLYRGDFMFFDSKDLLIYISGYYYFKVAKPPKAYLLIQMGTRTGRANIEPNYHSVEAGLSCDFAITTSATDRQVVYVCGEPRLWASFPGISWSTVNDNSNLKRKEFYSSNTLPSRLTMRITPPLTAQPGDYHFWVSIMRSPTTRCSDGMNPGDLFLVAVTVTPKQYKITLTSTGTFGEKNFGLIMLDGTTYSLDWYGYQYWGENVVVSKYSGSYSVTMIPPPGYTFKGWNTSGQITVADSTAESTIISILGDGTLEAIIKPILGNITGKVIDYETKKGVKSVIRYFNSWEFWEYNYFLDGEITTDDDGNFIISNVPSTTYYIEAWEYERVYEESDYYRPNKVFNYIPPVFDPYGWSYRAVTVIPNSTVIVTFELRPFPRLIVEPKILTVSPGESCNFNVSILSFENASWWEDAFITWTEISCYYNSEFEFYWLYHDVPLPPDMPSDLKIEPLWLMVEPLSQGFYWEFMVETLKSSNFSVTFEVYVDVNTEYGTFAIPIGLFLFPSDWCEVSDIEYVVIQVVPLNANVQRIELAEQNFDIIIKTNSTEVLNFAFNKSAKTISFEVTGPDLTVGYCNLTIPKTLMTPPFVISVNEQQIEFNITENSMFYFVYFTYSHSSKLIQITSQTLLGDSEPPTIISLTDVEELLTAEQNLTIYAFITDFDHEIDSVWLVYSVDGGVTWSEPIRMSTQIGHIYAALLTGLNEGDIIVYKIMAEDAAGNIAESEYYQVLVIPEFPSIVFLQLFMLFILAVALYLKKKGVKL
jgi:hypothetical protein